VAKNQEPEQKQVEPAPAISQAITDLLNATRSIKEVAPRSQHSRMGRSLYWNSDGKVATIRFVAIHGFVRALLHGQGTVALDEFLPTSMKYGHLQSNAQRAFETHDTHVANSAIISLTDILGGSGQSAGDKANPPRLEGLLWSWSIKKDPDGFPVALTLKRAPDPEEPVWPGILSPLWGSVDKITSFRIATDPAFRASWLDSHEKLVNASMATISGALEYAQKHGF